MATTDNQILHNYLKTKIDMDGVIPDYMLPVFALQELQKQDKELAALREAGEKMKAAMEDIQETETLWGADLEKSIDALEEWEAANK